MKMDETLIKPLVGLSISREAPLRKQGNTTLSFTDSSTPFAVPASNQIKTYANVSIGGTVMTAAHVSVSALVTGKIKKHERGAEAVLKVSYAF